MTVKTRQAVIFAGGRGTRISEESHLRPKPMVMIGPHPILWHIVNHFYNFGVHDFVILLGYKGEVIKDYFVNQSYLSGDIRVDTRSGKVTVLGGNFPEMTITLVDTGQDTMTGGRLLRAGQYLDDTFFLTYGDGISTVDLGELERQHFLRQNVVTLTAVKPFGRFGAVTLNPDGNVSMFSEKQDQENQLINGGFMIAEKACLNFITDGDESVFETGALSKLASSGALGAHIHHGFWHSMDTLRDKEVLNEMWSRGDGSW